MANSRDFTGKNRKFTGTKGIITPKGTTGERVGSESGELRFNTTTGLLEFYNGTAWVPVESPPSISTITTSDSTGTTTILNADGSTLYTITINGSKFDVGATVKFIGNTGTQYTAGNVTRVSSSQITCTTLSNMGTTDDPYDILVENPTTLSATAEDAFSYNSPPVFVTASSQLAALYVGQVANLNCSATDAEGNTITYSIVSGSLPGTGLSLSSSTGLITGTLGGSPSLGNYSFIVRASTTEGIVERQYSIQVIVNPYISASGGTIITSGDFKTHIFTGPGTFTVSSAGSPTGSDTVEYFVLAGGGGGGGRHGAGGGAGGFRLRTITTPSSPLNAPANLGVSVQGYPITVGSGGSGGPGTGSPGSSSTYSSITSAGGGYGGGNDNSGGSPGGSGGAGTTRFPSPNGAGNDPPVSPPQGNPGSPGARGGGGAGATSGSDTGGIGSYISNTFFGPSAPSYGESGPVGSTRYFGGGGGGEGNVGGDGGGGDGVAGSQDASAAPNNMGGGGGGAGFDGGNRRGGNGGSGIVVIRYKYQN